MASSGTLASRCVRLSYRARGIAAGKVGAPAALEEQGVARDQPAVDEEALAARGVAGGVDQLDRDVAHHHRVAALVLDELGRGRTGDSLHPRRLVALDVDGHRPQAEQLVDAGDAVARHVATDVVRVVVGGERARQLHVVLVEHVEDAADVVGRVDDHGLALLAVADEVDEVDHLPSDGVVVPEVATTQQLTEVQALAHRRPS